MGIGSERGSLIEWLDQRHLQQGRVWVPMKPEAVEVVPEAVEVVQHAEQGSQKMISLMNNCRPATRPFRASSSHFFFLLVLLIGLVLACIPVGFGIAQVQASRACGPFVNFNTSWDIVPYTVSTFPIGAQKFLYGIASEAFAVPFFVLICLVMFYFVALAGAHKRVVLQLREQLAMEGRDKLFLIRKLTEAQSEEIKSIKGLPRRNHGLQQRFYKQPPEMDT